MQLSEILGNVTDDCRKSGTGKELVARAIQRGNRGRKKPFIAVNCPAFHENPLESELFGHEKGGFTSSLKVRSNTEAGSLRKTHDGKKKCLERQNLEK